MIVVVEDNNTNITVQKSNSIIVQGVGAQGPAGPAGADGTAGDIDGGIIM